jgi:hypothetical protein
MVFVGVLFLGFSPKAQAGVCDEDPPFYRIDLQVTCRAKQLNPIVSIQRTINDSVTTLLVNVPSSIFFNANPDDLGTCGMAILGQKMNAAGVDPSVFGNTDIINQIQDATAAAQTIGCDFNSTAFGTRANGSLLGITKMAYDNTVTTPPPVNLAYYVKYNLQKVPIVGDTAYAQFNNTASYTTWGLEFVLNIWEKTRNIAYAMMSVIMLIIGILIVTRKRINPQTVVSVQTALPRVFISLALITFSYPIGAIMAGAVLPLSILAIRLVGSEIVQNASQLVDMDLLVSMGTIIIFFLGPQGVFGALFVIIMLVLTVIMLFVTIVKVIIVQLKIMLAIMFAPIQFAIAAIPGQEGVIQNWFKQMIARVLSIPAIFFMVALAWYFLAVPFQDSHFFSSILLNSRSPVGIAGSVILGGPGVSQLLTLMMLPILSLMTMFFALKADKAVEGFIMGGKDRRK